MGGKATFSGTTYQAGVIALAYVHMLAMESLGWFGDIKDVPLSVAGETDGPGDDVRLNFGSLDGVAEVQAKAGLSGGKGLDAVLDQSGPSRPSGTQPRSP